MKIELDDGFYFGIGAFETICMKNGIPVLLEKHLTRLSESLDFMGLKRSVTSEDVFSYIRTLDDSEKVGKRILKVAVSEKNVIFSTRNHHYTEEMYQKGFQVCISKWRRNETSPFVSHKILNHAENIIGKRKASLEKMDEVLFLNTEGFVSEGSCSNVFFVKGKQLITPSLECGLLPGVMRDTICKGEEVEERKIALEEFGEFDECFLTNSIMGIMSVNRIGNHFFVKRERTEELQEKYREFF